MELHKNVKNIDRDTYIVKSLGVFGPQYIVNLRKAEKYTKIVSLYRMASYVSSIPLLYVLFKFELIANTVILLALAAFYYIMAALCYHYVLTSKDE